MWIIWEVSSSRLRIFYVSTDVIIKTETSMDFVIEKCEGDNKN